MARHRPLEPGIKVRVLVPQCSIPARHGNIWAKPGPGGTGLGDRFEVAGEIAEHVDAVSEFGAVGDQPACGLEIV
jgi:hypothetical protein